MATSSDQDLNRMTWPCDVCGVNMVGIIPYRAHLNGKQHKRAVELFNNRKLVTTTTATTITEVQGDKYYCRVCNKAMTGPEPYQQHMDSAKHIKAAGNSPLKMQITTNYTDMKISRMDYTDALDDKQDDYYVNKHLKNVTVVEQNESIADALFKMGYI